MLCKWQLGQFMASWSPSSNQIWFGYFSPLKVILGAKVTNTTGDACILMLMMMVGCGIYTLHHMCGCPPTLWLFG